MGKIKTRHGQVQAVAHKWSRLAAYDAQIALQFASREDFRGALEFLSASEFFRGVPRAFVGDNTLILPQEATELLRLTAFRFTEVDVISASDLPADELAILRREQAPF